MTSAGLLVIRLTLALVLVAHGAHDLFGALSGPGIGPGGIANATAYFGSLGLEPARPLAIASGVLHFAGGLLIAMGLFTRAAAIAIGAFLTFLLFRDSARWGFFLNWLLDPTRGHGMEFALLLVGGLAALALSGAGAWSMDGYRAHRVASRAAGRARLRRN
jgi:putative oxidoreductase